MTYSHLNLDIVLELNDIDSVDKEYVAYSETVRGFGNMYPKIYFSSDEKIIITNTTSYLGVRVRLGSFMEQQRHLRHRPFFLEGKPTEKLRRNEQGAH